MATSRLPIVDRLTVLRRARKLRQFSRDDWRLLGQTSWLVAIRTTELHVRGFQSLRHRLNRAPGGGVKPSEPIRDRIKRIERMVELVARYGIVRGTCLSRSIALVELLARHGIPSELSIGVHSPDTGLNAHAWVEHDGVVLTERRDAVARFVPIPGVLGRRSAAGDDAERLP